MVNLQRAQIGSLARPGRPVRCGTRGQGTGWAQGMGCRFSRRCVRRRSWGSRSKRSTRASQVVTSSLSVESEKTVQQQQQRKIRRKKSEVTKSGTERPQEGQGQRGRSQIDRWRFTNLRSEGSQLGRHWHWLKLRYFSSPSKTVLFTSRESRLILKRQN